MTLSYQPLTQRPFTVPPTLDTPPVVWSVAGSDSGGGAGIQADLKTIESLGGHGCSAVTALTAQNPNQVHAIEATNDQTMEAQLSSLASSWKPAAIKIGMLNTPGTVRILAGRLESTRCFVVYDPVMVSSSGRTLQDDATRDEAITLLFQHVDLLTPNLHEAETLSGVSIACPRDMETAAEYILSLGVRSVLVKGGHAKGNRAHDFWTDGTYKFWLTSDRILSPSLHGTGCMLSSAIATFVGHGYDLYDALVLSKGFLNAGMRKGTEQGLGSPAALGWPSDPTDLPCVSERYERNSNELSFPPCAEPLGFYPIVDQATSVESLLRQGVRTIQLRVKDANRTDLEQEIGYAVAMARDAGAQLFINDHWQLALKHGAYGVHVGQDDLEGVDLPSLANAEIRLGISTHSYFEVARAKNYNPSYIAIGTIFSTMSKRMNYCPLGLEHLRKLNSLVSVPVVAIGGITLERARDVMHTGVQGCAVISDFVQAEDPEKRIQAWLDFMRLYAN